MLVNLYVINFVAVGLHSYAGTSNPPAFPGAALRSTCSSVSRV
jgi:hypothetical protein